LTFYITRFGYKLCYGVLGFDSLFAKSWLQILNLEQANV